MNRYFLIKISKFLVKPLYYLIHYNFFFGLIQRYIFKSFTYKNFEFEIDYNRISISYSSSFLFKTYEYNDRILIEKYITKINKSIIIGGGIGFIGCLNYKNSSNEFLITEIDKSIISLLERNLKKNNCKYKFINGNLVINKKDEYENFYINKDFIANSSYIEEGNKEKIKNFPIKNVENYNEYNTLIIDGEGVEEHFLNNISDLPNIIFIFFELHDQILSRDTIEKIFDNMEKNHFKKIDNCFNSFYFKKDG